MVLVTAPGPALSAMTLMPKGAVVVLAEAQAPCSQNSSQCQWPPRYQGLLKEQEQEVLEAARGFARAAGLSLAVVGCHLEHLADGAPEAAPGLLCSSQALLDAMGWAARRVYAWQHLPGPKGAPHNTQLRNSIPGSGLKTPYAVREFRKWQDCVSNLGKWLKDPVPRPIAWPYRNVVRDPVDMTCDRRYLQGAQAVQALETWRAGGAGRKRALQAWRRIRPGLAYRWSVDPKACNRSSERYQPAWRVMDAADFCRRIPSQQRKILFLGDSLQHQMAYATFFTMLSTGPWLSDKKVAALKDCPADVRKWQDAYRLTHRSADAFRVPSCAGMGISFLRSNQLQVSVTQFADMSNYKDHLVVTPWSTVSLSPP